MRSNVDFPIPLIPTIAASSPFFNLKEILETTTLSSYPTDSLLMERVLCDVLLVMMSV
ncbi:hypothetical protein [uncultured Maribacter sp.]|uniref:hypothetical protein n=1 Tax=uncultured Maribacter sp. TaxID=431308 RepID=UPI00262C20AD|nr:hypothetical protein [uncultured Maribacter sp.]